MFLGFPLFLNNALLAFFAPPVLERRGIFPKIAISAHVMWMLISRQGLVDRVE